MSKVIKVSRSQVEAAKDVILLSKVTGQPVPPAIVKIANAKPAARTENTTEGT